MITKYGLVSCSTARCGCDIKPAADGDYILFTDHEAYKEAAVSRWEKELILSRGKVLELSRRNIELINELEECQKASGTELTAIKKAVEDERENLYKVMEQQSLNPMNQGNIYLFKIAVKEVIQQIGAKTKL